MFRYLTLNEVISHTGLRIVLVQGLPSPWGQAAKTILEIKGLEYVAAPWIPGAANDDIVAWGGERSAPVATSDPSDVRSHALEHWPRSRRAAAHLREYVLSALLLCGAVLPIADCNRETGPTERD